MKAIALKALLAASLLFVWGPVPRPATTAAARRATQAATPAALGAPAGAQYVSPMPGSQDNPAATTIAVRYGDALHNGDFGGKFAVSGSSSGAHSGMTILSDDQQTLIFKPDQPFTLGETVTVAVGQWNLAATGKTYDPVSFSFGVAAQNVKPGSTTGTIVLQASAPAAPDQGAARNPQYLTAPANMPSITVTAPANNPAPGYIFVSNFQLNPGPSGYYLMILDNNGQPVFYKQLAANSRALDFKPLPDGTLSYADDARDAYVLLDNTYREIGTVTPGNGYQWTDEHDLELLPNGHYLLMANEVRTMDLSAQGGSKQAAVTAQVIQELDRSRNVVFQWRLLDNFPITATTEPLDAATVDFSHSNALAIANDGNLLVSSRHLDEVTKIDLKTGAVIWHLGGKANQFTITTAPGVNGPAEFYHQHDVRQLANGDLTVFDNHNGHDPQVSRALEYKLDEGAHTATLVWSYQTDPAPYALAMGNVQRLDNGDTMIGWGTNGFPNLTEVKPDGSKALELDFGGTDVTYRAFRADWQGHPGWAPALEAQATGQGLTLAFSWNGATGVASYQVYAGDSYPPANLVSQPQRSGFESSLTVPAGQDAACFYQVVPVNSQGQRLTPSPVVGNPRANMVTCAAHQLLSMLAVP